MELAHPDLDLLSSRLRGAQLDYEFARSRGDGELMSRSKLRISAIMAERDRLVQRLSQQATRAAAQARLLA
jgi:hypothetical protein